MLYREGEETVSYLIENQDKFLSRLGKHGTLDRFRTAAQRVACIQHLKNNISCLHNLTEGNGDRGLLSRQTQALREAFYKDNRPRKRLKLLRTS